MSTACWCSAQPAPAGKPGRLRKMQAPSTTLVLRAPSSFSVQALSRAGSLSPSLPRPGCICHSSSPSSVTTACTRSHVVVIGEVRAQRAAAVVGAVGVDALAARAEDAGPARRQPGEVEPEPLGGVRRVGHLGPGAGDVERCLGHAHHPMGRPRPATTLGACASGSSTSDPTRSTCSSSTRTRGPSRCPRRSTRSTCASVRARHRRRPDRRRGPRPARRLRAGVPRRRGGPGRGGPQRLRHERHP